MRSPAGLASGIHSPWESAVIATINLAEKLTRFHGTLTIELRDGTVTLGPGIRHPGDVESELTVYEYARI